MSKKQRSTMTITKGDQKLEKKVFGDKGLSGCARCCLAHALYACFVEFGLLEPQKMGKCVFLFFFKRYFLIHI